VSEPPDCRLYLITPPVFDAAALLPELEAALDAVPGLVAAVQLRCKPADDAAVIAAAEKLMPAVQQRDVAFILNDRPDLAARLGCDGVHIGQGDGGVAAARAAVGAGAAIGVSCEDSRHLAMTAGEQGADYIAFGPVFATDTKHTGDRRAPIDLIAWWSEMMEIPSVAIGGITPRNCRPLVEAGADFLAVIAAVWNHPDGAAAAVSDFAEAMAANSYD